MKIRLLPGWKPLSDLVFILTCSTHSRLLLCGQSQSSTPTPAPTISVQAFKRTSLFYLTLHHLLSRGHFPPLFLLFNLPDYCPWQPLWKVDFFFVFLRLWTSTFHLVSSSISVYFPMIPSWVHERHFSEKSSIAPFSVWRTKTIKDWKIAWSATLLVCLWDKIWGYCTSPRYHLTSACADTQVDWQLPMFSITVCSRSTRQVFHVQLKKS